LGKKNRQVTVFAGLASWSLGTPVLLFHKEAPEAVKEEIKLETEVRKLLASQKFAVLSTQEQDHPYLNLVAFAETSNLRTILFATTRATRKYGNLSSKSGVALLVDNRSNEVADIREAMAVTIIGSALEVPDSEREGLDRVYLEKQPHMKEFFSSPSTALVKVEVESYLLVSRFQNVTILNPKS
jgi:nitroimidazol reductase NimA-like FMN-containing flavoprotein (pyridoxamine 5'-phosphate oxidase superfamily)